MKDLEICEFYGAETGTCMFPYTVSPYMHGFFKTSPDNPMTPAFAPSLMEVSKHPAFNKPRENGRWEYYLLCRARAREGDGELTTQMALRQRCCDKFEPGTQKIGTVPLYYSFIR